MNKPGLYANILALKAWGASSKEDARAKAHAISERNRG
jgi:hypothetical protein